MAHWVTLEASQEISEIGEWFSLNNFNNKWVHITWGSHDTLIQWLSKVSIHQDHLDIRYTYVTMPATSWCSRLMVGWENPSFQSPEWCSYFQTWEMLPEALLHQVTLGSAQLIVWNMDPVFQKLKIKASIYYWIRVLDSSENTSIIVMLKCILLYFYWGFPGGLDGKQSACNAGDQDSIPGSGIFPREGNGNSLQYSYLENPMNRRAWRTTVHGVTNIFYCMLGV